MARIVMVGGGMVGTCAALLLHRDGHQVTVLERDHEPPCEPDRAWDGWQRRGVTQFRQPHGLLARFTHTLRQELPELADAFVDGGALRLNPIDLVDAGLTGGRRAGDDRFDAITGRRPLMEAIAARALLDAGVDVRRGVAARGLVQERRRGRPHVTAVVSCGGEVLDADLVIDAGGRRSVLPGWLETTGGAGIGEEQADCGFVYYARHYHAPDGRLPALRGPVTQPYGSVSTVTLPADHSTWSVVLITSARDRALRTLRDPVRWEDTVRRFPLVAHWTEAEPITDVEVMAGIVDRRRRIVVDGRPVATGLLLLGDAWAATNPSLGRGITIGLLHAVVLRDALREAGTRCPDALVETWQALTDESIEPYVADTFAFDRHRLAEMNAAIEGRTYQTDDRAWLLGQALRAAARHDADAFRDGLDVTQLLRRGADVLGDPAARGRLSAGPPSGGLPGPSRDELVDVARAA